MTVKRLIALLSKRKPDAEVFLGVNGGAYQIGHVELKSRKNGWILLFGDERDVVIMERKKS